MILDPSYRIPFIRLLDPLIVPPPAELEQLLLTFPTTPSNCPYTPLSSPHRYKTILNARRSPHLPQIPRRYLPPPFPDHTEERTLPQLLPPLLQPLPDLRVRHNIQETNFVRSAHPIKVHRQLWNRCPKVAGNSGEKVSERRPQLLTFHPHLTAHGRTVILFFLCPGLQSPVVRVVIPYSCIDTTSGPTSSLSSLSRQHPWQERNYKSTCHIDTSSLPTQCASQVEAQARPTDPFDHSPFPIRS
jgi:hypothetical protein